METDTHTDQVHEFISAEEVEAFFELKKGHGILVLKNHRHGRLYRDRYLFHDVTRHKPPEFKHMVRTTLYDLKAGKLYFFTSLNEMMYVTGISPSSLVRAMRKELPLISHYLAWRTGDLDYTKWVAQVTPEMLEASIVRYKEKRGGEIRVLSKGYLVKDYRTGVVTEYPNCRQVSIATGIPKVECNRLANLETPRLRDGYLIRTLENHKAWPEYDPLTIQISRLPDYKYTVSKPLFVTRLSDNTTELYAGRETLKARTGSYTPRGYTLSFIPSHLLP